MTRIITIGLQVIVVSAVLSSCARSPEAKRDKFLEKGKALLEQKEYSRAVLEFRNAAQAMPRDAEAYYQLGLANLGLRNYRLATSSFQKATQLNPKHVEAQIKLAELMNVTDNKELLTQSETRMQEVL